MYLPRKLLTSISYFINLTDERKVTPASKKGVPGTPFFLAGIYSATYAPGFPAQVLTSKLLIDALILYWRRFEYPWRLSFPFRVRFSRLASRFPSGGGQGVMEGSAEQG